MLTDSERAELAKRLRKGRQNVVSKIPPRPAGLTDLPLSYGQEQLWFVDRFAPGLPTYNIPFAVRLSGPVDAGAMSRAVDSVAARHEALRTRLLANAEGRPVQVIDPPRSGLLELVDLSGLDPDKREAAATEFVNAQAVRPFTLAEGPLLRIHLLRLSDHDGLLLVVVHHTVFDGWSIGVFVRELAALYAAEVTGEPAGLDEVPVQLADYALWERDRLVGASLAQIEDYWRATMKGFETIQFPTDRPRPVLDNFDGGLTGLLADTQLLDGLRELSRRERTTLFVTVMAALMALMSRHTGQTDLVLGTASANRGRRDLGTMIGFLVNTLPIRADLSGDPPFTELLARVAEATTGAYAHQDLPFGKLVETLEVERDPSRAPVFQIAMSYVERNDNPLRAAGVEFVTSGADLGADLSAAKFDLDFGAEASADGLRLGSAYKTRLFDAATVRRLVGNWEVLLRGVLADPSARLSQLPVLTEAELHRELVEWNDTDAQFPALCIHQAFEQQAAATPQAGAARYEQQRWSYAELNRQANRIARRLRELGVGPESLVGVCLGVGLPRLASLIGVWKAGGGYVPLDTGLPADRLSFMISDTGMSVVLTDEQSAASVPALDGVRVLSLDAEWQRISALEEEDLTGTGVEPSSVAYVIYTSGSTGEPKGVVVEHRQAINFLQGMAGPWRIGPDTVTLAFAAFTFDVSVCDMFLPLLHGGSVVLAAAETLHSPQRLAALIREAGVTFACLPPAVLSLLVHEQFPGLRILLSAGSELSTELFRAWLRDGLELYNGYGPTEASIGATFMRMDASTQLPPPIGRPKPNYRVYVLDEFLNPVPVGVTGELHIGGAGVARGYLNRPELTRERFIGDPFAAPGGRLYKTGDLVRRRADGTIVFAGRIDDQVKIRGLRVELGEIESALLAHPGVAQAVVSVVTDAAGEPQLAGYLRPGPDNPDSQPGQPGRRSQPDLARLRAHLAGVLPGYMIPAYLTVVQEFPITANGKIDKAALPDPQPAAQSVTEHAEPASALETALARLYGTVLNRPRVGATDSFFDIGGSSLQVMRLVEMINTELGVDIGVSTIFLHSTPRQLAAGIEAAASGGAQPGSGSLVELSSGPGELPLVLIHAVGGTVFGYAQLARELAGQFRVYGLEAPGLRQPGATAASLAAAADDYTRRIRAAQPDGPYRLAGWSMGGVIAFEIARRLEQAGAQVSLLTLLDAPYAIPDTERLSPAELAGQFIADATHSLGWDAAGGPPDPATATADEQLDWLAGRLVDDTDGTGDTGTGPQGAGAAEDAGPADSAEAADSADAADREAMLAQLRKRLEVFSAHAGMLAGYQPDSQAVRAPTLIVSADDSPNAPCRSLWPDALAGPVRTRRLASDHYAFLRPPLVAEVGRSILDWHDGTE
jgi:amino acid adenylation domain-containing protein